jgi:hypothetical protein
VALALGKRESSNTPISFWVQDAGGQNMLQTLTAEPTRLIADLRVA